ncbi:ABC transporter permease [Corynebacterium pygosceleis]|uniref:ABC transporter permease n=1 Tax=Corynebacterium pygosceleis TaxID=2800406 RepID=A0A9Q4GJV2_9CORY|nr:ABC transporter permease [Corynebacterium pygosceleis]MCK7636774.1 ABC transporter permease [Corynebacterium pygosceleis]MCK7674248.1 ABC transporter permease [Corynebacterium pygosceleis]MCL0120454.1 ABC transporter permease [Corynebacterium pygosceleis]MCX7444001.1 ABC transporter permease [Corynebacterium pygosceleis]MCX7467527.1 ABC transporter permease [Corynebacterium pygosceleis]
MIKYLLKKTVSWVGMIFIAVNITYFLASGFLNPRSNYAERRPPVPEERVDAILTPLNLNDKTPLLERWWTWLTDILFHWNWGTSPIGDAVNEQISYRVWVSARLMLLATALSVIIGISIGVYTASRQYRAGDRFWQFTSIFTMNIHIVVATLIVVWGAIRINHAAGRNVFYVTGASSIGVEGFWPSVIDLAQHLILPTVSLVIISYAGYHFLQRSLLLDNINADYVRTARAKGLTRGQAVRRHALRTSIIPVATTVAFSIPGIFTGAVMTETIFGWQGMGQYFIQTISRNDIHGVVAVAAFGAAMTAIGAILSDVFVVFLDPRVRVS